MLYWKYTLLYEKAREKTMNISMETTLYTLI